MALSTGRIKGMDPARIGLMSNGIEQDRDDAFLINQILDTISFRTRHHGSSQVVATALFAIDEDCHLTLPIFGKCLTTDDPEIRREMVYAIIRSIRDLIAYAQALKGEIPRRSEVPPLSRGMLASAWYPSNALSVLACWHYYTAEEGSPIAQSDSYLTSPIWDIRASLCDGSEIDDHSLPETLSWAAEHPSVEMIRAIVTERGITNRDYIAALLETQSSVPSPITKGIL